MATSVHRNSFDALRLAAALMVLAGHGFRLNGADWIKFAGTGLSTIGVQIFFIMSGYLIAKSWLRDQNMRRFLLRRVIRIWPGLIVAVLLTTFVLGPLFTNLGLNEYFSSKGTWLYLLNIGFIHVNSLPGVFQAGVSSAVNSSLWSLSAEISLYALLPLLLIGCIKITGRTYIFPLFVAQLTISFMIFVPNWFRFDVDTFFGEGLVHWLAIAPYFLMAACYAICEVEELLHRGLAILLIVIFSVVPLPERVEVLLLIPALPFIILSLGLNTPDASSGRLGQTDLSYGVYLYAFPIQQALLALFGQSIGVAAHVMLTVLITMPIAWLSWRFIERPCLRWKPKAHGAERAPPIETHDREPPHIELCGRGIDAPAT